MGSRKVPGAISREHAPEHARTSVTAGLMLSPSRQTADPDRDRSSYRGLKRARGAPPPSTARKSLMPRQRGPCGEAITRRARRRSTGQNDVCVSETAAGSEIVEHLCSLAPGHDRRADLSERRRTLRGEPDRQLGRSHGK